MAKRQNAIKCVISYSHRDEGLCSKFYEHLQLISRTYPLDIWLDKKIKAGSSIDSEVKEKFNSCDLVFILVSSYYINSNYCYEKELQIAYKRHNNSKCIIVPVILSDVKTINDLPFGNLNRIPRDGKPIRKFKSHEDGLAAADEMIIDLLKDFKIDNSKFQIPLDGENIVDSYYDSTVPVYQIVKDGKPVTEPITQEIVNAMPIYFNNFTQFDYYAKILIEKCIEDYKNEYHIKGYKTKRFLVRFQFEKLCNFLYLLSNKIQNTFLGNINTRIHFRRLNETHYEGFVVSGFGENNDLAKAKELTKISSQSGMIYLSGVLNQPLLRSFNFDFHEKGNNDDLWVEHLTCTFKLTNDIIPNLSMGISLKEQSLVNCQPLLILMAYTRFDKIVKDYIDRYMTQCKEICSDYDIKDILNVNI